MILNDKVYLGDTLLDLGEANGVTLEYSISDPADMAAIFTPGSWTVNLPKSAVNLQAFGFMTEPGSTTDAPHKEHPCMIIRNGVPLFDSGKLTVIDVTDTINVVITWNTNERLTELSGRKLRDLAITKVMRWDPATFETSEDNDFKWVAETGYKQAGADGIMNYNARGFRPAVKASYLLAALLPGLTIGQTYWNRLENVWLMLPTTNGNETIDAALTYRGYGAYSNYDPVLNVRDVMRNFKEYGTIAATYDLLINQSSQSNPFSGLYIPKDGRYRVFGYIRTSSSAGGSELYNGKFRLMLNLSYDRDENGALVENYENLYYSEYPINSNNVFDVTVDLQAGDVVTIFNSYQLTNATISGDIAIDLNEVATENTDTGYLLDYPIRENLPAVGCIEFITALFSMVALQAQTSGTAVKVFSIDDVISSTEAIDISPYINDREGRQLEYSHGLTADNVLSYADETDAIHFAANTYNKTVNKVVELPFSSGRDRALYRRDKDGRFEFVGEDTAMALARSGTASIRVINDHISDSTTRTVTVSVFGFGGLDWATLYGTYWQGYKGVFADNQRVVKYNAVVPESFVRTLDFSKPVHDGVNRYLLMRVSDYTYTGDCTLMMALLDGIELESVDLANAILDGSGGVILFDDTTPALYDPPVGGSGSMSGKLIRELEEYTGGITEDIYIPLDLGSGPARKRKLFNVSHVHGNKSILDVINQGHLDVLSHFSVEEGRIKVNTDFWSTGEVSAYGAGSGTGTGGTVGSLGGLANVGLWADDVPASDRIMVQLAGATHWSSKLLSEIVGLDTVALSAYLTTNKYTTETYVNTKVAELVGSSPATLDTLNELAAALGNDPNFATSMTTLIGTKWTQDNSKIANWDSAYNALHSHANKTELDGITSTLINNWNLAFTNNHTHPNKSIIDNLTQANLDVLAKLSIVDGNLKVDTNLWSTGEVSAYGAGSGTGGGGTGLITSVLGSAGLGGSYLDSDLTNSFNAYTINLINTNLTSALGRIGALETSTPNVAWGNPTSQYSPLTINSITRNLSVDGHSHSYLPLSGGALSGGIAVSNNVISLSDSLSDNQADGSPWYGLKIVDNNYIKLSGYFGLKFQTRANILDIPTTGDLMYNSNKIWHAGNDGAGSGLDADTLDGIDSNNIVYGTNGYAGNNIVNADFNTINKSGLYTIYMGVNSPSGSNQDKTYSLLSILEANLTGSQLAYSFYGSDSGKLYARGLLGGNFSAWRTVAFEDSNVASATKLLNTMKIWGKDFNGENNVDGLFRCVSANEEGLIAHKILTFPAYPYGLITRIYNDGGVGLQAQREVDDAERFKLLLNPNGGKVGIGTLTPRSELSFGQSSFGKKFALYEGEGDGSYFYGIGTHVNGSGVTGLGLWGGTESQLPTIAPNLFIKRNSQGGYVGIGTDNPSNKLSVKSQSSGLLENQAIKWENESLVLGYIGSDSTSYNSGAIRLSVNGVADQTVISANGNSWLNGGNVGIGTTAIYYKLDVNGTFRSTENGYINGDLYVGSASSDKTVLVRNISSHDSGVLTLNPWGGNVCIGTSNAIEKLYVNGSTKVNGHFRVSNDCISAGEYEDDGYGFINVCRTASIENASYFSMVRAGTAAFGIGLSTDNSIIIGGAGSSKTINNIHLKLNPNYVITDKPFTSTNRIYTGYDSGVANSISCSGWFRSNGDSGWYNQTYGAGILSETSNVVRTYSTNKFKVYNTESDSIYTLGGLKADQNSTLRGLTLSNGSTSKNFTIGFNGAVQIGGMVSSYTYTLPATIGWYRIAMSPSGIERCSGQFDVDWTISGYHGSVSLNAGAMYGSGAYLSQSGYSYFGTSITKSRIVYHTSYAGNYAYLEVYNSAAQAVSLTVRGYNLLGWTLSSASTAGSIPSGYSNKELTHSSGYATSGNIYALGEVTAYSASDVRLKCDIQPLSNSLCLIEKMNPVSYTWNDTAKSLNPYKGDGRDFGLIAQELESVLPELVHTIYGGQYKSIDYIKIIPHLIVAIKQLKMEVDHLKKTYY